MRMMLWLEWGVLFLFWGEGVQVSIRVGNVAMDVIMYRENRLRFNISIFFNRSLPILSP
jgi:hypothetical protein